MKKISKLCYLIVILTLISTLIGIFYSTEAARFWVVNIYGESIELFGDGIYKYNSILKAAGNKGTDAVMLLVAVFFGIMTYLKDKSNRFKFLQAGALAGLLYYSACLVFGVTFNRLFPVYVLLFSSCLFAMIGLMSDLIKSDTIVSSATDIRLKGTSAFLIICGLSVLVWLEFVIGAIATGEPLSVIEIYTTEPTFVLDLAIILPVYVGCGLNLLRKNLIAYKLTPVLLTFIVIVGMTVISQNLFQTSMGIEIPPKDLITLVLSFVILGMFAVILNFRFQKYIRP